MLCDNLLFLCFVRHTKDCIHNLWLLLLQIIKSYNPFHCMAQKIIFSEGRVLGVEGEVQKSPAHGPASLSRLCESCRASLVMWACTRTRKPFTLCQPSWIYRSTQLSNSSRTSATMSNITVKPERGPSGRMTRRARASVKMLWTRQIPEGRSLSLLVKSWARTGEEHMQRFKQREKWKKEIWRWTRKRISKKARDQHPCPPTAAWTVPNRDNTAEMEDTDC